MFGFTGGDIADTILRKRMHMADAQARWPFLTYFGASTIKKERQLVTMVKERCSLSQAKADDDAREWMEGKAF